MRVGPLLSEAVRMNVAVHAVEGVGPGSYVYDRDLHALLPRRSTPAPRAVARAAALDQDVVGDAAVVFVLSIDRAAFAADPLGPARGYRHAFLEAGLVGERIYLHAAPHRLAVCAVGAFYDDEAAAWLGVNPTREWVVHLAAMGPAAA
jgi:SagB-type dehydrogenase family enzyme